MGNKTVGLDHTWVYKFYGLLGLYVICFSSKIVQHILTYGENQLNEDLKFNLFHIAKFWLNYVRLFLTCSMICLFQNSSKVL